MGWKLYAENEDEKVLEKQRDDGGTELIEIGRASCRERV